MSSRVRWGMVREISNDKYAIPSGCLATPRTRKHFQVNVGARILRNSTERTQRARLRRSTFFDRITKSGRFVVPSLQCNGH